MSIKNISIFIKTQKHFKNDKNLLNLTKQSVENTVIYFENFKSKHKEKNSPAVIYTEENPTLTVAIRLRNKYAKVAALNFANATTPGGGVILGADAQEEYLCRTGNLYNCLTKRNNYKDFYFYHISKFNTYYSDRIIYSRGVAFFDKDNIFDIDVITSSAPNINFKIKPNMAKISDIFISRIRNILESAIDNNIEAIVLGAFGCGAFGNDPNLVAEAFRKILIDEHYNEFFKEIVFAIKHSKNNKNFTSFNAIFPFINLNSI